jgi:hypothetical protein
MFCSCHFCYQAYSHVVFGDMFAHLNVFSCTSGCQRFASCAPFPLKLWTVLFSFCREGTWYFFCQFPGNSSGTFDPILRYWPNSRDVFLNSPNVYTVHDPWNIGLSSLDEFYLLLRPTGRDQSLQSTNYAWPIKTCEPNELIQKIVLDVIF